MISGKKFYKFFTIFFFVVVIGLTSFLLFFQLGTPTLDNWDEAWYGQMTKEMMASGDFFIPHWNYEVLLDKPPLQLWINSTLAFFFGLSELTIRLPSAISALIIILATTYFAYKKWGLFPAFLTYVTLAFNNLIIWRARSGNLDLLATLLIVLSFFILLMKDRKKKYLLLGLVFGLLYLAKASLVFLPIAIFVLHELFFEIKNWKKNLSEYAKLIGVVLFIAGFWLVGGYLKGGREFLSYYLFSSDQGVSNVTLLNFKWDYISYAYYSLQRRFFYLFLLGGVLLLRKITQPLYFLLLLYALPLLVMLSFTERNNNWYLIPAMPFWSLIIGFSGWQLLIFFKKIFRKYYIFPSIGLFLLCLYIAYRTLTINIFSILATDSTGEQAQAAKKLATLTGPREMIVRLDHLYPTTIYYSSRKTFSSPPDVNTTTLFISRSDLVAALHNNRITWLTGTTGDVDAFIEENPDIRFQKIPVTKDETLLKRL